MDFSAQPDQQQAVEVARRFAQEVLEPAAAQLDRSGGFPREHLARAAKLGLLGINIPRRYGGLELGAVAYASAIIETARACASTTVAMCVSNMVAEVVAEFGSDEQRSEHVPKLCDGTHVVGAFALSEPQAGSDPGAMQTRARPTDRGWVLNGSKLWITSGSDAGLFVVWARTSDAPGTRGISAFLVPGDTPGLERGKPEDKLGLHGSTTTALTLADCEVPAEALLGERERGFPIAMMALDGGRIGIAAQAVGVGQAALARGQAYLREHADLAGEQGLAFELADAATELEAARCLALQAAWRKQQGLVFSREAAIAKVFASERAFAACNRVLDVMGVDALALDRAVERYFRDVRVTMIYEGTSEIQRVVISRDIARRFAQG